MTKLLAIVTLWRSTSEFGRRSKLTIYGDMMFDASVGNSRVGEVKDEGGMCFWWGSGWARDKFCVLKTRGVGDNGGILVKEHVYVGAVTRVVKSRWDTMDDDWESLV